MIALITHTPDGPSYQVLEATPEEEAELMSLPAGAATAWIENNATIITREEAESADTE